MLKITKKNSLVKNRGIKTVISLKLSKANINVGYEGKLNI